MPAQKIERAQKRQTQNGEIVALDALEKLNAESFQLVAADTRQRRVTDRVEIAIEKFVGERPHRQSRGFDMLEQHGAVLHKSESGVKFMRAAAQAL